MGMARTGREDRTEKVPEEKPGLHPEEGEK